MKTITVILFKVTGRYYIQEEWRVPEGAIVPSDMYWSPDWRTIGIGPVLVKSQEPWGYPHLLQPFIKEMIDKPDYLD